MAKKRFNLTDVKLTVDVGDGAVTIGGAEECTITVTREVNAAHEAGSYKTAELVEQIETVEGSLTRAFIDGDVIKTIYPQNQSELPEVTITGAIQNQENMQYIRVVGAKFKGFDINGLGLSDYAKNALNFQALDWDIV